MKRLLIISVISTLICGVIFTGCDSDKINPEPQDPNEEVPVDAEQPASGLYVTGVASVSTSSVKAAAETVFTGDDIVSFNVSDGEIIFAGNRMEAIMAGVERHSELYFYIDGKPVFDPAIRIHPGYGETFEDFDLQFRTASPDIHDGVKVHLTDVYMNIDTLPESERLIKQQEMETNKAKRKKELDVLISYLDAAGKMIDVKTDDPAGEGPEPEVTGIRIKDNPCETLRYIRKIGTDFESALDSLRIIRIILSGITGRTPLEVIFDTDNRQFYGIVFGGEKYTDVLDTKGYWYERTYKCANLLTDSKWKLIGIMDIQDISKELDPKDCENCYTLYFNSNSMIEGTIVELGFHAYYNINHEDLTIQLTEINRPDAEDIHDGEIYFEILSKVQAFELKDAELKLYNNDEKYYLLYKRLN